MRAYPVIIYTEPTTNQITVTQVDDKHGITVDVEHFNAYCNATPNKKDITIKATATRTVEATDSERDLANLARVFGKEIDRQKEHARNEYERGRQDGKRYVLNRVREMLEPEDEGREEA
ncbi:MAG: hypothetical protein E6Z13_00105 [Dermabacter sp.]|nr:hypothetical protein [Dermabacter sp.]